MMLQSLAPFGDPISKPIVRLVVQMWDQNPVILVMVVGLVLFGIYAATGPLRERGADPSWDAEGVNEPG
jgi:hypothetical protein